MGVTTQGHARFANTPSPLADRISAFVTRTQWGADAFSESLALLREALPSLRTQTANQPLRFTPVPRRVVDGAALPIVDEVVAEAFDVAPDFLHLRRRDKGVSWARHTAMYVARRVTDTSFPQIALYYGFADHTSAMYGYEQTQDRMNRGELAAERVEAIIERTGLRMREAGLRPINLRSLDTCTQQEQTRAEEPRTTSAAEPAKAEETSPQRYPLRGTS